MKETSEAPGGGAQAPSESELIRNRHDNLGKLVRLGHDAYPFGFPITATVSEIAERYRARSGEELERERISAATAGRVLAQRNQGKAGFLDLSDGRSRLQLYVRKDVVGDAGWELSRTLDLGDWIGVEGEMFKTRTGELSIKARKLTFLAKCLRPLPEKWHGLRDIERRHRQRYLDLAVNPESRQVFETRATIIRFIRRFLDERGYLEV